MIQKLKFTDGCPNGCEYCYEPKVKFKYRNVEVSDLPIQKDVQILDMNFLANPLWKDILFKLPKSRYEMVCGFDYRRLTLEACKMFKAKGFHTIRWAWDLDFKQQKIHSKVWRMFRKAGFRSEDLSVFMLVNWKTPYEECCKKLDLLKVWNVKVNDCCFDGGYKIAKPKYWTAEQMKDFRRKCRKHNQMVMFKIDPEVKE